MSSFNRKQVLVILAIALLTIAIAVIPDIISSEVEAWCLEYLGPNYKAYLIAFFILASIIVVFLTTGPVSSFFTRNKAPRSKNIKINWSIENARHIRKAKDAIQEAKPEEALKQLYKLKNAALDESLSLLANRMAQFRRESLHGVQTKEEENVTFRRINQGILSLITMIERSLEQEEKVYNEVKDYLRQRYERRLSQKLAGRQPVNLRRHFSTEGTSEETSAIFETFASDKIQDEISKTFQDAHGRLLIIGAPGSGKTTLMLQLELSLLESEQDAIPVVLNLASWQRSFITLETWLEKILPSELGVNSNFAKKITQQFRLILLLDGFDEVREEERQSCLEAIGRYGADAGHQYVIASRIQEYKAVAKDAPVYSQIEVGPLTIEQLESELKRIGFSQPGALRLLQAIRKDELLREAVQTPFYFNAMQLMFAEGKNLSEFNFSAKTAEGRQDEIMNRFVAMGFEGIVTDGYSSEQAQHWLSYFSYQMNRHNMVAFELSDLQYDWWHWTWMKLAFPRLLHSIIIGLPGGLPIGLSFGLAAGLAFNTFSGLPIGIIVALLFGLFAGQIEKSPPMADTRDNKRWSLRKLVQIMKENFLFVLLSGLLGGLLGGLLFGPYFGPFFGIVFAGLLFKLSVKQIEQPMPRVDTRDNKRWSFRNLVQIMKEYFPFVLLSGLLGGLLGGLLIGPYFSLFIGIAFGLSFGVTKMVMERKFYSYLLQINTPYQRFQASTRNLHFSILQHWLLRYQLYRQGLLPLRLVDFLNEMAKRHLLESDGASWRFRHLLIQDYFAEMWEEPEKEQPQEKGREEAE